MLPRLRQATRLDLPRISEVRHGQVAPKNRLDDHTLVTPAEVEWYLNEAIFLVSEDDAGIQGFIPKAPLTDSWRGFHRARFLNSFGRGSRRHAISGEIAGRLFSKGLRTLAGDRRMSARAVVFCRWRRFAMEWTGRRQRRSAWHGSPDVAHSGSITSTFRGRMASSTTGRKVPSRACRRDVDLAQFAKIVEAGPDREKDGIVRWRRVDLKRVIAERFGVDFHPRYVGKLLKKLGFSHISARPRHPAQDERIVEGFKKTSRAR